MRLVLFLFLISPFYYSQSTEKEKINTILNNWHHAASVADEEVFFETTMSPNGIYIGTDASELWTRTEMQEWSNEIFKRESAWDFKVVSRNIYFSKNNKVAWFDEILDTWMGVCRGSGVLEKVKGEWKLMHYHLAIAVPNEVVQEYLELLNKQKAN